MKPMAWLLVGLVACGGSDPSGRGDALVLWESGVKALEAGNIEEAEAAFAKARDIRPDDLVLIEWQAKAAADAGNSERAVELLDTVLGRRPDRSVARYNRAAYHARLGDGESAAKDLKRAVEEGARAPREVLDDPDFRGWIGQPGFEFLPEASLDVVAELSDEAVFWGSDLRLRLRIRGADGEVVAVTPEQASGPLRLLTVVEDVVPSSDGVVHDLTWTFRVVGAGDVSIGPMHVVSGGRRVRVDAVTAVAKAPPDRVGESHDLVLSTPRELVRRDSPPKVQRAEDGALLVLSAPQDRVELSADSDAIRSVVRYEARRQGIPEWVLRVYPPTTEIDTVQVVRGGQVVLDAKPG